jgi:hypothetical protein
MLKLYLNPLRGWRALVPSLLVAAGVVTAGVATAHDDAWWIEQEPTYRRADNTAHCCSKYHCNPISSELVERVAGGWVYLPSGQLFADDQPYGLYQSIDIQFWGCTQGAGLGCLFTAKTGF